MRLRALAVVRQLDAGRDDAGLVGWPKRTEAWRATMRKPAGGPRYGASHRRPAAGDRARESVCLELNSTLRSSTGTNMRVR